MRSEDLETRGLRFDGKFSVPTALQDTDDPWRGPTQQWAQGEGW